MIKYYYTIFVFLLVVAIAGSGFTGAAVSDLDYCPGDVDNQLLSIYSDLKKDYDDETERLDNMALEYRRLMLYFSNNIDCFCENKNYWQLMVKIKFENPDSLSKFYLTFAGSLNNLYQQCPLNHPERSTADLTGVETEDASSTPDLSSGDLSTKLQPGGGGTFVPSDIGRGKISAPVSVQQDCTSEGQCEMIFTGECTLKISAEKMCESQCPVDCIRSNTGYICTQ